MIDEICDGYKVNEDSYGNILVALTEALSNAIHHGNKSNPEKSVDISFEAQAEEKLLFTIKDEGDGFDPDSLPDPTDPENLEKPHGRGVFLMRNLADEVSFDDDGRTVELLFNIAK